MNIVVNSVGSYKYLSLETLSVRLKKRATERLGDQLVSESLISGQCCVLLLL